MLRSMRVSRRRWRLSVGFDQINALPKIADSFNPVMSLTENHQRAREKTLKSIKISTFLFFRSNRQHLFSKTRTRIQSASARTQKNPNK